MVARLPLTRTMSNQNFKVGDIVISKKGTKPARVTYSYANSYWVSVTYLHNDRADSLVRENLVLYNEPTEMTQTQQNLYQFKTATGATVYGSYLATNQNGQWVMEEKGNGQLHTVNKNDAEEVLPYTFSVKMRGNTTHFVGTPDQVCVGDVLMYTGGDYPEIAVVSAVNTKNKNARAKFTGRRLVTEALPEME